MGMIAVHGHHLPHHFHIANATAGLPAAPGWAPVVLVAAAIFALGLWWASTKA